MLCNGPSEVDIICASCLNTLPFHSAPACPQCGLQTPHGEVCGHCLKSPYHFDRTVAAFEYDYPIVELMRVYKYGNRLGLANFFAQQLIKQIKMEARPDVLLPMPLHKTRLRERGFNQAAEIVRHIASEMNLPMSFTALTKTRDTPPQAKLPWDERRKNIKDAFECKDSFWNRHVVILDDVITTGASLNEAAKVIKKQGAKTVSVWVVARTQLKN